MARTYTDPPADERCQYDREVGDGGRAQCGRRKQGGSDYCWQHQPKTEG